MIDYSIYLRPCCQNKPFPGGDSLKSTIAGIKGIVSSGMMDDHTATVYLKRIINENCCADCKRTLLDKIENPVAEIKI